MRYLKPVFMGISRHAVESEPEDLAQFRRTVDDAALSLQENCSPGEALAKIGLVLQVLEDYNARANQTSLSFRHEFRGILSAMTDTIASVSLAIISFFCAGVKTSLITSIVTSGITGSPGAPKDGEFRYRSA